MTVGCRANVSLPSLTKVGLHTKYTKRLTCVDPYQTLPDRMLAVRTPLVVLAWSTNAYQSAYLGLTHGCTAFTNHYHREEGLGIMYCHNGLGTVIDCGQHPTGLPI